jgi:hypothetical protein
MKAVLELVYIVSGMLYVIALLAGLIAIVGGWAPTENEFRRLVLFILINIALHAANTHRMVKDLTEP